MPGDFYSKVHVKMTYSLPLYHRQLESKLVSLLVLIYMWRPYTRRRAPLCLWRPKHATSHFCNNPTTISNNKRLSIQEAMISEGNACADRSIRVQICTFIPVAHRLNIKAIFSMRSCKYLCRLVLSQDYYLLKVRV